MNKFTRISEFAELLFNDQKSAQQAGEIMQAILETRSPRISDIASRMKGSEAACYKRVQRFFTRTIHCKHSSCYSTKNLSL